MSHSDNSSAASRDDRGREYNVSTIRIRDTILMCKVEGMQKTTNSLAKIELHLESIAQSLAIIADAKAKLEEE